MILSYNWQVLQNSLRTKKEVEEKAKSFEPTPEDSFASQESGPVSINPISLKSPKFGFLFCYLIESPTQNQPEIELLAEVNLFEDQVRLKTLRLISIKNCIYLQLQIQSSQIYDSLMVFSVKIKYHMSEKLPKIRGVQQLVRLAGQRQINLYSATTYATIRREIILQSPVSAQWRQQREAYLYLKLFKNEESSEEVEIIEVQVMNWLSAKQEIRQQLVSNVMSKAFKLGSGQSYGLVFRMQGNIQGQEIPYFIKYRYTGHQQCYKLVKYIRVYDYR